MNDDIQFCPFQAHKSNERLPHPVSELSRPKCIESCALAVKQDDGSIICSIKLLATKK